VFDLGGNVAEWAGADENLAVLLGGDYRSKDKAACFRPNSTFGPGHKNDRIGFRCCSDSRVEAKGKAVAKKAPSTLIGQRLPSFTGDLLEGGTLESGSLGGEVVYLSFFASWCSPCKRELPALNELQKKYADRGLRVIGVGVDTDPAKSERMARQLGVEYPVILDPRGKILGLFDVKSMPTTYLVGRNGTIVEKLVGWGETAEKLPKVMQRVEEEL
jgi:thiol-disulfide isomerase/thioredoxin